MFSCIESSLYKAISKLYASCVFCSLRLSRTETQFTQYSNGAEAKTLYVFAPPFNNRSALHP